MTIEEAKIVSAKEYHIDNFTYLAKDVLLPDYAGDVHDVWFKNDIFSTVKQLGTSEACELTVFEVYLKEGTHNRRVAITQEMFKILHSMFVQAHPSDPIVTIKTDCDDGFCWYTQIPTK